MTHDEALDLIAAAARQIFEIEGARDGTAEGIYDVVLGVLYRMEQEGAPTRP